MHEERIKPRVDSSLLSRGCVEFAEFETGRLDVLLLNCLRATVILRRLIICAIYGSSCCAALRFAIFDRRRLRVNIFSYDVL